MCVYIDVSVCVEWEYVCVCVRVQGGGPADAKLSIMFTDTTHFNGFCAAPRIEKSSHFKRVAHYGSPLFTLMASAI